MKYLFQIAVKSNLNAVIDYYRSKSKDANLIDEDQMLLIEEKRNIREEVEVSLDIENLQPYLLKLKDTYREVIILKYIEEFSIKEISSIIDKSSGNVRVLLHRALAALKEIIEK